MALFKIEKGLKANLANNRPNTTEGFCYFTTDDGKFYIDTATAIGTSNRVLLNAGAADKLTVNAGAANKPIYFKDGVPTEGSYELNKTVPSNAVFTDTNTKVTQTVTTSNAAYPLLLAPNGQTATTTTTSYFDSGVTLNPSTNTITATTFAGNLSGNATSATQASYVLDYNNNTPTYFGYSTSGMSSADWIAAWDVTVSGQYRLRAIQPGKLSVAYAQDSNNLDGISSSGFARRFSLGGLHDFQVAVIGLFPVATANDTGSAHHVSGRITANRRNGLYASPFIDFCMNDFYSTGSKFNVSYNGQNIEAFIPCTFIYGGVRYAGFKFAPGNAQCSDVTFIGQTTYTPFMVAYYHNNNGVINSEINNSINTSHAIINGQKYAGGVYGAVWNDYAEYRNQKEEIKPGYCVASNNNGQVYKTTEKFQACDGIVSDTFGFAIGETDECKTPLAVAGRVLAYCEGDRYSYHSGDTVCAGPDGKIVKMTREEIREWPDRIIGIVSEIPEYETWGTGNVAVDGRIWIKVK